MIVGNVLVELFVKKWASGDPCSKEKGWRLLYAASKNADTFSYAEGECSYKVHKTMAGAIAYGEMRYGETAQRWPTAHDEW